MFCILGAQENELDAAAYQITHERFKYLDSLNLTASRTQNIKAFKGDFPNLLEPRLIFANCRLYVSLLKNF